jgi:hypothetical protein
MAKLSKQDKIDIYNNWKNYGYSTERLAKQYSVCGSHLRYLVRLIDRYGTKILDHSFIHRHVSIAKFTNIGDNLLKGTISFKSAMQAILSLFPLVDL